jgi:hypothetical protein
VSEKESERVRVRLRVRVSWIYGGRQVLPCKIKHIQSHGLLHIRLDTVTLLHVIKTLRVQWLGAKKQDEDYVVGLGPGAGRLPFLFLIWHHGSVVLMPGTTTRRHECCEPVGMGGMDVVPHGCRGGVAELSCPYYRRVRTV